jgi:hypothetical protein
LLGFFTFHFNGARQGITLAIFVFSLIYILEKKQFNFYLTLFLGFLFHKSILIAFPFYYLFNIGFTRYSVFIITTGFTVIGVFMGNVIELASEFDDRYSGYANNQFSGGGVVTLAFNIFMFIWLFIAKYLNNIKEKLYDICLIAMLCCCSFGAVSVVLNLNPSGVLRLTLYFSQFLIFGLPISVMTFKNKKLRLFFILFFIVLMSIYFYLTTTSFSKLYPYAFDF